MLKINLSLEYGWANRRAEAENVPVIRRRELDQLEFVWDPFDADWEDGFRCLTVYREREGHCRVPARHRENGFPLGTWVSNKRKAKDSMRVDHRLRLNQLGFVWDPFQVDWEEGLRHLQNYREREGNCR